MKKYIAFLGLLLFFPPLFAQVGIGSWREHLPYRNSLQLEMAKSKFFCLTESGLFSYSFEDSRVETYSKITGLSDVGIQTLAFDEENDRLLIAYGNGNLDVWEDNQLTNIPDIKKAIFSHQSGVNTVLFEDDKALLGTDFGIVLLNFEKAEVADTYLIAPGGGKVQVNDLVSGAQFYWVATSNGIFRADRSAANLSDFNNWSRETSLNQYQRKAKYILAEQEQVFVIRAIDDGRDELLVYKNNSWTSLVAELPVTSSFRFHNGQLWIVAGGSLYLYNADGDLEEKIGQVGSEVLNLRDALPLDGGDLLFADYGRGVLYLKGQDLNEIRPEGPLYQEVEIMDFSSRFLWVARGGVDENFQGLNYPGELSFFTEENWGKVSPEEIPSLAWGRDFIALEGDPLDPAQVYVGSWGNGLYLLKENELVEHWNHQNSLLGGTDTRIAGIASDAQDNIWVLDAGTSSAIKVRSRDGEWSALEYGPIANQSNLRKIIVTGDGDKWVLTGPGKALFAMNENGTLSNNDDDVFRSFSVRDQNQALLSSQVFDMIADKDGNVWLGTEKGVMVYAQPGNLLRNENFYAYRPVISIDGNTQYLLGTEKVNCIAVDGANQKWLGTQNSGVFLVSQAGDEQLYHFNSDNCPLLSNTVKHISVDPNSGEVFFATSKGLISYKGKVTEPDDNFSKLYVYPNPVRENYTGDIVVSGLMEDSSVKITDVGGNLIYEDQSKGGQMIWDGRNFSGSRVHTGVYLIFCASSDGAQSKVIKLLFIN